MKSSRPKCGINPFAAVGIVTINRMGINPLLIMIFLAPIMSSAAPPDNDKSNCAQCHPFEVKTFHQSAMSRAAQTANFKEQWQDADNAIACLDCHAPSSAHGVTCNDCHGESIHLKVTATMDTDVCARCHDAPLENTYRHYRSRPAALAKANCIDCHMRPSDLGIDHNFRGPDSPDLLSKAVTLRWLVQEAGDPSIYLIIKNRTAHAIPGGTSGRSLWLLIKNQSGEWQPMQRFGWLQTERKYWIDYSLPPGVNRLRFQIPEEGLSIDQPKLALWLQIAPGKLQIGNHSGYWLYRGDGILKLSEQVDRQEGSQTQ